MRDDKKQSMGVDQASRKWVQDSSEMDIDTHRSKKEINTEIVLEREVVEEEITDANTAAIEKIKKKGRTKFVFVKTYRSRRWCFVRSPVELFSIWAL